MAFFVALYLTVGHSTTKNGKASVSVAPDAYLVGGVIIVFCLIAFFALRKRRRTVVAFSFFINGLALTLVLLPLGIAMAVLGGWLMLRAFRINKYGTASAKNIARSGGSSRPARGRAKSTAPTTTTKPSAPAERRPPTASKRYTPKASPRRKAPKATE